MTAIVIESNYTISGTPVVILQCELNPLPLQTELTSSNGQQWTIESKGEPLRISSLKPEKREMAIKGNYFLYILEAPDNKRIKPETDSVLQVKLPS